MASTTEYLDDFSIDEPHIVDSTTSRGDWDAFLSNKNARTHFAYQLSNGTRLGLPTNSRLRKDSTQVIYYGTMLFDVWSYRLNAEQVVCLSLFDGQRTLHEVAQAISFLSDCNMTAANLKVRKFLAGMDFTSNSNAFFLIPQSEHPPTKTFDPKKYLLSETRRSKRLDAPLSLMIMPTDKCQTDCVYCYACRQQVASGDLVPVKRLKELIDEAAQLGVASINMDGGDLFARPEHMEILEHVIGAGIDVGISTKGFISKKKSHELKRIGLPWLQVGLDSTGEMADRLTRRPGYFERMIETIHNLADAGIPTRTNSIIMPESLHLLPELVDLLMTLPLRDIKVAPAFRGMFRGGEEMLLTQQQKVWFRATMREAEKKYPNRKINWECQDDIHDWSPEERQSQFNNRPYCSSGRTQIIITPDGKVTTCEQSPQTGPFICGDVMHQSIEEVWNSQELREWFEPSRENFKGTACYDCGDFESCIHSCGHCWLNVLKMYGRIHGPHPYCPKAPLPTERWN